MAEKETINKPKDLIEPVPEELSKIELKDALGESIIEDQVKQKRLTKEERKAMFESEAGKKALEAWVPKTNLGRLVKEGKIKNIKDIFSTGRKILESEIVDSLLHLEPALLLIGQAKGKFGGGKRRAWRQTQRKTMEGNVVTFSCMAAVGDKKRYVGVGYGKAKETLPARAKALRNAKLNIIKITRGYETPEEGKTDPHTVPFVVEGKCGSIRIKLIPAPRGTGLVIGDESKKILRLAGIQDVYAVTKGQTRTTFNVAKACIDALKKTNEELL
ncbi:MAG: 30S ribosomal protein S5 [Nanoarchaeota archaeon]